MIELLARLRGIIADVFLVKFAVEHPHGHYPGVCPACCRTHYYSGI